MQTLKINTDTPMQLPEPAVGDFELKVFAVDHANPQLPSGFELWQSTLEDLLSKIPLQEDAPRHFVTITSTFLTSTMALRRTGAHIDGNFCIDPDFFYRTWGGTGWAGLGLSAAAQERFKREGEWFAFPDNRHVTKTWPLNNEVIPYGKYVSPDLGGLVTVSSLEGCRVYDCKSFDEAQVGHEGSLNDSYVEKLEAGPNYLLPKHKISFMSSNTPHNSEPVESGQRRTLLRLTLAHNYQNQVLFH